jgi:hypothetical protein
MYLNGFGQFEYKYDSKSKNLPQWVELMYSNKQDPGLVMSLYKDFYKQNDFIKNKHTQYYKRYIRNISRETSKKSNNSKSKSSNQWQCIGPWDFDISVANLKGGSLLYDIRKKKPRNNGCFPRLGASS